jgi:hypothetical protein
MNSWKSYWESKGQEDGEMLKRLSIAAQKAWQFRERLEVSFVRALGVISHVKRFTMYRFSLSSASFKW